jgi:myo-inositol-1(or 4)-monophosphatase
MANLVEVCEEAARLGGAVLMDWIGRFKIREKGPADLVTEADLASQNAIRTLLADRFSDHVFLGEEDAPSAALIAARLRGDRPVWIVDPLDGTTNYAHGEPHFCVSVAVVKDNAILAGAVLKPVTDECFTAERGSGAQLNGQPIHVSDVDDLRQALVGLSFPPQFRRDSIEVEDLFRVMEATQAVRRSGSAALNLCYVAAARYDAYWATKTNAWDVAAGCLIVEEAGGVVTALDGSAFDLAAPWPVAAATAALSRQLIKTLDRQ